MCTFGTGASLAQVIGLALVVAVAGAVVLAAAAGARRTASSFDRFATSTRAYDVLVFFRQLGPSTVANVRRIPGVEAAGLVEALAVQFADGTFIAAGAPTDDVVFRDIARTRIVAGRDVAPGAPEEIVIGEPLAAATRDRGRRFARARAFTPEQIEALIGEVGTPIPEPEGPRVRVDGGRDQPFPGRSEPAGRRRRHLAASTRVHRRSTATSIGSYIDVVLVRLKEGSAGVPASSAAFVATFRDDPGTVIDEVEPTAVSTSGVRESIDVLAIGLAVFAGIAAISALVVIGFVIARLIALRSEDVRVMAGARAHTSPAGGRAGASRARRDAHRRRARGARAHGSRRTLMPMGLARRAEPSPGLQFDVLVLVGGAVAAAAVAVFEWRSCSRGGTRALGERAGSRLARPPWDAPSRA